jgi:hypothetical protein
MLGDTDLKFSRFMYEVVKTSDSTTAATCRGVIDIFYKQVP